jgi:hypothetical protein
MLTYFLYSGQGEDVQESRSSLDEDLIAKMNYTDKPRFNCTCFPRDKCPMGQDYCETFSGVSVLKFHQSSSETLF